MKRFRIELRRTLADYLRLPIVKQRRFCFWERLLRDRSIASRRAMAIEPLEPRFALAAGLVDVGSQPIGALAGKVVFTSAGHGWQWSDAANRWATDRGNTVSLVEDFGNQDQLTYYVDYLFRAGATIAPMRPVGRQINEVVLDNDSAGVTFTGTWSNNTAGPRWYDEDYGANLDAVKYRFASVSATTETATATYTPNLPASGLYPVYTWVPHSSNRTNQLYKINHTGGTTEVRVDHRNVGNGWVYLGSYHFASGSSVDSGSVQISNRSSFGGSVVIADSIRFGNGMGDMRWGSTGIGNGNVSGFPREDEGSILWAWRGLGQSTSFTTPSTVLGTSNVSAPLRMAEEMHADGTPYGTSIYISFHSNATTGDPATATARGAIGLIHSTSPTPNQSDLALFVGRQLNVDMRALNGQFEHDWSTRTTYTLAGSFGETSNVWATGEFDATIIEVGFHDTLTDNELLRDSKVRRQLGRSTYEATLEHFFTYFGTTTQPVNVTIPSPPINVVATSPQSGSVVVRWTPGPSSAGGFSGVNGSPATGYRVYASIDGYGFDGGTFVSGASTSSLTLSGYNPSIPYYFKVVAENSGGQSTESEVLTVNPNGGDRQILIVNGFDRIDRSQNFKQPYAFGGVTTDRVWERYINSRDYTVQVQSAIQSARPGIRVDSTSNEAVINGTIVLSDYEAVIWILGTESVANQSFSATEQTLVNRFVDGGGDLLVTGSEVGYDLDLQNNGRTFYRNTLGASYVADSSGSYVTSPVVSGIFAGLSNISFSNGSVFSGADGETYNVAFADVLTAQAGSAAALQYVGGAGGVAATQKPGTNGRGSVVTFGFPLETIVSPNTRSQVIDRILGFFNVKSIVEVLPGMIVPMYQYPLSAPNVLNEWWQKVRDEASATTPITVIANPSSGPIAPTHPDYTNWITGLTRLRDNPNIRILGYVKTRVSPTSTVVRSSNDILADVASYSVNYKHPTTGASLIDGIFLDEMSNDVTNVSTYANVAAGIRSNLSLAGRTIVGNPGTAVPVVYLDQNTADLFIIREGTPTDLLNNADPSYVSSPTYAAFRFGAMIHSANGLATLAQMLREIKRRGLDYVFVTDDTGSNPYDQSPTYFSTMLRDLRAPFIVATTFTLPENSANGTSVGAPVSGDPDAGQTLSYSIIAGNATNAFAINSSTGQITVNNSSALDFESMPTFLLTVQVTDNGTPPLSDAVTITINLSDVNEPSSIANRRVFYNNATGANLSSVGSADNAIASDKTALLPGGSSVFANYTNYALGLNGVIIDINQLPTTTTNSQLLASLQFAQWNGIDAGGFTALPAAAVPMAVIMAGNGVGGTARVKVTFPDNALQNTWLRVIVLANPQTALTTNDVFYFGNVIGDFDTGNTTTRLRVNATDTGAVRSNQSPASNSASVTNIYDVNRDGRVNATDTGIVRSNQQTEGIVAPITAPSSLLRAGQLRTFANFAPRIVVTNLKEPRAPERDPIVLRSSFVLRKSPDLPLRSTSAATAPASAHNKNLEASIDTKKSQLASTKLQTLDQYFAEIVSRDDLKV